MPTMTLPWPPTVNHYWRHVDGKVLISATGRRYRSNVGWLCKASGVRFALGARLSVEIQAFPPDRRRRDLDNLSKSLLDALGHGGVYADDSQIDRLLICRGDPEPAGKVIVTVTEL